MSSRLVRWLVLAALALPVAVLLSPVQAQVGRPGIPRPPGGIGGMPGGGGIGGMPGGHGPIGPPQHEWRCSHCNALLGTGPIKPRLSSCPQCGAKFANGIGGPGLLNPPQPGGPPPGEANVPPTPPANEPPPPPAANEPIPPANHNNNADAPAAAAENAVPVGSAVAVRTVLIILAIVGGIVLLFGALCTFLYISISRAAKENVPQRRRKRVYHDED
jgi:hypothetical protein